MPALGAGIDVLFYPEIKDVDGRDKPAHDPDSFRAKPQRAGTGGGRSMSFSAAITAPSSIPPLLRLYLAPHDWPRGDRRLVGVEVGERSAGGIALDHRLLVFEHVGIL